jgi:hypothetical protein
VPLGMRTEYRPIYVTVAEKMAARKAVWGRVDSLRAIAYRYLTGEAPLTEFLADLNHLKHECLGSLTAQDLQWAVMEDQKRALERNPYYEEHA